MTDLELPVSEAKKILGELLFSTAEQEKIHAAEGPTLDPLAVGRNFVQQGRRLSEIYVTLHRNTLRSYHSLGSSADTVHNQINQLISQDNAMGESFDPSFGSER